MIIRFREHRGSFFDSMATSQPVDDMEHLTSIVNRIYGSGVVQVKPYGGIDHRNNWDTQAVTLNDQIVGFTSGPFED